MARRKLTDKSIAATRRPASGRLEIFDEIVTGLCFRITDKGARSWSLLYRVGGKLRRDTLGPYPRITLAIARQKARDALELVGGGTDPRTVKATTDAAAARQQAETVDALAERFIARHASQRRWGELERVLRRDVVPQWTGRPVAEIGRRDVIDLLDAIADRAPVQANRTLTVLKIFFGWCLDRDVIEADPTTRVQKPTKEESRDRVLSDAEIRAFWLGCKTLGWPFGMAFRLLLLTAQRKSEIAELNWPEFDEKDAALEFAGARYKTGRPHRVPLSKAALELLASLPRLDGCDLVFSTNGKTPISGFSKAKDALDREMLETLKADALEVELDPEKVSLPGWRIHDLRRTARSGFSRLGIPADIGERVLGHVIGGVRGVYDRHSFEPEMRHALEAWAAHLESIINPPAGPKVVPLRGNTAPGGSG